MIKSGGPMNLKNWFWNLLISLDQLGNSILGGSPDETISARAGRYAGKLWYWTGLAWALNKLDPGHTRDAIKSEQERAHYPPVYRTGPQGPGSKAPQGEQPDKERLP